MKKILVGIIIGACLMFSSQVFGEELSLIGRKISKEVTVKMLGDELDRKAILLDGVTYVPLRVISEELGLEASYENGEVVVRRPGGELVKINSRIITLKNEIEELTTGIENVKRDIKVYEKEISDNPGKTDWVIDPHLVIQNRNKLISETEQRITQLKSELSELEAKKEELSPSPPVESPTSDPAASSEPSITQ